MPTLNPHKIVALATVTDVSTVDVGDTITANGALKNYKGTYEFNGCTLEARTASTDNTTYANAAELLAATHIDLLCAFGWMLFRFPCGRA